jgi:hypothetical protein
MHADIGDSLALTFESYVPDRERHGKREEYTAMFSKLSGVLNLACLTHFVPPKLIKAIKSDISYSKNIRGENFATGGISLRRRKASRTFQ